MELVGADADLRPRPNSPPSLNRVLALTITAELSTRAVNSRAAARSRGDDRLGVLRTVAVDVLDRLVERADDLDRDDRAQIFRAHNPLRSPAARRAIKSAGPLVAADLDPAGGERLADARQELGGRVGMDQQRFGRVADAQPLALGVDRDPLGHVQVGRAIDIDVAVAGEVLDDRHFGLGRARGGSGSRRRGEWPGRCIPASAGNGRPPRGRSCRRVARRRRGRPASSSGFGQADRRSPGSNGPPPCRRGG